MGYASRPLKNETQITLFKIRSVKSQTMQKCSLDHLAEVLEVSTATLYKIYNAEIPNAVNVSVDVVKKIEKLGETLSC